MRQPVSINTISPGSVTVLRDTDTVTVIAARWYRNLLWLKSDSMPAVVMHEILMLHLYGENELAAACVFN